jgi:hypothetical protein
MLVANQLTRSPKDDTNILVGELIGFASEPATGSTAASRATVAAGSFERAAPGAPFGDVGSQENAYRGYISLTPGQLWATSNFWTTVAATTQGTISGAELGDLFEISCADDATGEWGLVNAGPTVTADVAARLVYILNARGEPQNADFAATTTGPGTGITLVFEIANIHELTQVMGG